MAKLSIYVTDELKARMDAAADLANWSETVRPAILAEIAAIEHRKGKGMGTMIERLRASKEVWWQENKAIGKQAGRAWAHDRAEYGELVAVARIDIGLDCYQYDELAAALGEGLGGEDVARALGVVRADLDKEPFMIGFIEAAKEVFEEVEHKL